MQHLQIILLSVHEEKTAWNRRKLWCDVSGCKLRNIHGHESNNCQSAVQFRGHGFVCQLILPGKMRTVANVTVPGAEDGGLEKQGGGEGGSLLHMHRAIEGKGYDRAGVRSAGNGDSGDIVQPPQTIPQQKTAHFIPVFRSRDAAQKPLAGFTGKKNTGAAGKHLISCEPGRNGHTFGTGYWEQHHRGPAEDRDMSSRTWDSKNTRC